MNFDKKFKVRKVYQGNYCLFDMVFKVQYAYYRFFPIWKNIKFWHNSRWNYFTCSEHYSGQDFPSIESVKRYIMEQKMRKIADEIRSEEKNNLGKKYSTIIVDKVYK